MRVTNVAPPCRTTFRSWMIAARPIDGSRCDRTMAGPAPGRSVERPAAGSTAKHRPASRHHAGRHLGRAGHRSVGIGGAIASPPEPHTRDGATDFDGDPGSQDDRGPAFPRRGAISPRASQIGAWAGLLAVTLGATYGPGPFREISAKSLILLMGAQGLEPWTR